MGYMYIEDIWEARWAQSVCEDPHNDKTCIFLSPAAPEWEVLKPPPPVCPYVHLSFSHSNSKMHWCISLKLCRYILYVHHLMVVCCVDFDIHGMLFEFVWILNRMQSSIFHIINPGNNFLKDCLNKMYWSFDTYTCVYIPTPSHR